MDNIYKIINPVADHLHKTVARRAYLLTQIEKTNDSYVKRYLKRELRFVSRAAQKAVSSLLGQGWSQTEVAGIVNNAIKLKSECHETCSLREHLSQ